MASDNTAAQIQSQMFANAMRVAQAFAQLNMKSAAAANAARLKAAKANIKAGTQQITMQSREEKNNIAQALARHAGTLAVNAAYRGTGGSPSTTAALNTANLAAGRQAANVSANAAFAEARLVSENNPQLEDVRLAGLEGGLRGFGIGQQLGAALLQMGTSRTTPIRGGGDPRYGGTPFTGGDTIFNIPGIDLASAFGGGSFADIFGAS